MNKEIIYRLECKACDWQIHSYFTTTRNKWAELNHRLSFHINAPKACPKCSGALKLTKTNQLPIEH